MCMQSQNAQRFFAGAEPLTDFTVCHAACLAYSLLPTASLMNAKAYHMLL